MNTLDVAIILFEGFEPLDAFGPAEVLGSLGRLDGSPVETRLRFVSTGEGAVQGSFHCTVRTETLSQLEQPDVLLIPGGAGTRPLVRDADFIEAIRPFAERCEHCLAVCTGSAVLAATGLLDGRSATSNKRAFDWVISTRPQVNWHGAARWITDGKFVTSSGVGAGIDMTLGFVAGQYGDAIARRIATDIEYRWNDNPEDDPFARE